MQQNIKLMKHDYENNLFSNAVVCDSPDSSGYLVLCIRPAGEAVLLVTTNNNQPRLFKSLDSAKKAINEIGFDYFDYTSLDHVYDYRISDPAHFDQFCLTQEEMLRGAGG